MQESEEEVDRVGGFRHALGAEKPTCEILSGETSGRPLLRVGVWHVQVALKVAEKTKLGQAER